MAKKEEKTNVMRVLEQKKIPYTPHTYPHREGEAPDGVTVAQSQGLNPDQVFKTLVTKGASGGYYVFDIPVAATLDLKKAAKVVGEKSVAMLHSRSCSPSPAMSTGAAPPSERKSSFLPCSTRAPWNRRPFLSPQGRSASRWSCPRRT